jgi:hypothetical protein
MDIRILHLPRPRYVGHVTELRLAMVNEPW